MPWGAIGRALGVLWGVLGEISGGLGGVFGGSVRVCGDSGAAFCGVLGGLGWVVGNTGVALETLLSVLELLRSALGSICRSFWEAKGGSGRLRGAFL